MVATLVATSAFLGLVIQAPTASAAVYFSDDLEAGIGNWVISGYWHAVVDGVDPCAVGAYSGTWTLGYHIDASCDFDDGATNSGDVSLASPIDLTTAARARLTFKSWYNGEGFGFDLADVYVSDDGGASWTFVFRASTAGPQVTWNHFEVDLTPWAGSSILLQFFFDTTDAVGNNFAGWFVDDIQVDDDYPLPSVDFFSDDMESGPGGWGAPGGWRMVTDPECVGSFGYPGSHSPTTAWGYNLAGFCDYDFGGAATDRLQSPLIDLSVATWARLGFYSWYDITAPGDQVIVQAFNGVGWDNLLDLNGAGVPMGQWRYIELDLSAYLGMTTFVGFSFSRDGLLDFNNAGWYVDDVTVSGDRVTLYSEWQPVAPNPDGLFLGGEHIMNVGVNAVDMGAIAGNSFPAWLIVENDADFLYITYDAVGDVTPDPSDQASFSFDTDRDFSGTDGADDQFWVDGTGMMNHYVYDALLMGWLPEDPCDPGFAADHAGLACASGFDASPNDPTPHRIYEFRIPLALIDVPLPVMDGYVLGAGGVSSLSPGVWDTFAGPYDTWPIWYPGPPPLIQYGDIILAGNDFPVLDWTGEAGYTTDGVEPDTGPESVTYTYRILYQDPNNDPPGAGMPELWILDAAVPIPGSPFPMAFDLWAGAPGDYQAGAIFTLDMLPGSLPCTGSYEYFMNAADQWGFFTSTPLMPGPTVLCNQNPVLDWTNEPYFVLDGIEPHRGDGATTFEWRVLYTDPDDDAPGAGDPVLRINDGGIEIPGSPFGMTFDMWATPANNYIEGAIYAYSMVLPCGGTYTYWFETTDGMGGSAVSDLRYGPQVACPNVDPTLDWTGEPGYGADGVDPDAGPETGTFTYRVDFWDTDGDLPFAGDPMVHILESGVEIAGSPFTMMEDAPLSTIFFDDFEGAPAGWTASGFWHEVDDTLDVCSVGAWSATTSWGYHADGAPPAMPGEECSFDEDGGGFPVANTGDLVSPPIDLGPSPTPTLSFQSWLEAEGGTMFDLNEVWLSDDGGTSWNFLLQVKNDPGFQMGVWHRVLVDLTPWAGSTVELRFTFNTVDDAFNNYPGWFIDDVWVYEGDGDTTDGKRYTYDASLGPCGGTFEYFFTGSDANGGVATGQPTVTTAGPTVFCAPVLDWTGEAGYTTDGLEPEVGDTTTTFTYRILYTEGENEAPGAGFPALNVYDAGVPIAGSPFTMILDSWVGTPGDYVAGAIYTYDIVAGTLAAGGDYSYLIEAEDTAGAAAIPTPLMPGPIVTIPGNDPPEARDLTVTDPGGGDSMHVLGPNPDFAWSYFDPESAAQTDYQVRVGTAPGLSDMWAPPPAGMAGLTESYAGLPLVDGTDYWVGVRVWDDAQPGPWNETLFHTNGIPPAPTTPVVPPDLGTVDAGAGTTVSWTSGGADPEGDTVAYDWEVATDPAFTVIIASGTTFSTTSDGFATTPLTTYYWRARACDNWECSGWSSWQFDTTAVINDPPVASFPGVDGYLDGTVGILHIITANPVVNWTYSDPESVPQAEFEVYVGTAQGVMDVWAPGPAPGAGTSATYAGPALSDGTDYWVGVRVSDGVKWSAWAEVMAHTNTPPPAPTLTAPANGATDQDPATVTLVWGTVTDAEADSITYYWYLSTSPTFATLVDSGTTASTTVDVNVVQSTQYYWRVQARDGWEFGANSSDFDFTTGVPITTGTVSGRVTNAQGQIILAATVQLVDDTGTVVDTELTGANGRFTFTDVDFGTYSVRVTAAGFQSKTVENVDVTQADPDQDVGTIQLAAVSLAPEIPLWLIALLLLIIIVVIVALLLLMRRRKPAEEAPPPPGPPPEAFPPPVAPEEAPPAAPEEAPPAEPDEAYPPPEDLPPPEEPEVPEGPPEEGEV